MNYEHEIQSLAGETLALTSLVGFLLLEMSRMGPNEKAAVSRSFEMALDTVTGTAMRGVGAPTHTMKAIKVIEQLRETALGK